MEEIDVWRAAKLMVDHHGDQAQLEAIEMATVMVGRGDRAGQLTWLAIFNAIGFLTAPGSGNSVGARRAPRANDIRGGYFSRDLRRIRGRPCRAGP